MSSIMCWLKICDASKGVALEASQDDKFRYKKCILEGKIWD